MDEKIPWEIEIVLRTRKSNIMEHSFFGKDGSQIDFKAKQHGETTRLVSN